MTVYSQFGGGMSLPGGDLAFRNLSGLDIPANTIVILDTTHNNMSVMTPVSAGAVTGAVGVTTSAIPDGKSGPVRCYGVAVCTANGTIAAGDTIQASNTTAKLGFAKTAAAATTAVGMALTGASDGNPLLVLMGRALNALASLTS